MTPLSVCLAIAEAGCSRWSRHKCVCEENTQSCQDLQFHSPLSPPQRELHQVFGTHCRISLSSLVRRDLYDSKWDYNAKLSSGEPFIAVAAGRVHMSGQRQDILFYVFCSCSGDSHKENLVKALILRLFYSFPSHAMQFFFIAMEGTFCTSMS